MQADLTLHTPIKGWQRNINYSIPSGIQMFL